MPWKPRGGATNLDERAKESQGKEMLLEVLEGEEAGVRPVRRLAVGKKEGFQGKEADGDKVLPLFPCPHQDKSEGPVTHRLNSRSLPGGNKEGGKKLQRRPGFSGHRKGFGFSSTRNRTTKELA